MPRPWRTAPTTLPPARQPATRTRADTEDSPDARRHMERTDPANRAPRQVNRMAAPELQAEPHARINAVPPAHDRRGPEERARLQAAAPAAAPQPPAQPLLSPTAAQPTDASPAPPSEMSASPSPSALDSPAPSSTSTSLFDPSLHRLISPLASWTVSSYKPSCGVPALLAPSTDLFWQSDGPQPHLLNIHFSRLVSISAIRLYLDFSLDESYTPTKLGFWAGMGQHDLEEVVEMAFEQPRGWIDVDLSGVGGGRGGEGGVLRARVVQVKVMENHQNGKDTHVRGLEIYSRREEGGRGVEREDADGDRDGDVEMVGGDGDGDEEMEREQRRERLERRRGEEDEVELRGLGDEPDWMGEVVLR